MFKYCLQRPVIFIFAAILLALSGLSALRMLPVDLFPNLDYPLINIITHYPAGTAEDMEQLITRPIESAMLGLNDLQRVRSTSSPGFSQISVEFTWGVDAEQARQRVFSRLAQMSAQLPVNARPELENIGSSLAMLSTYILQGDDPVALRSWVQYQLAPRLATLNGVARVEVMGGGKRAWRVDIDPLKLQQSGLNINTVSDAIYHANILNTGGYIEQQGRDLLIRTDGRLLTLDDLKNVVVGMSHRGVIITLSNIADIYQGIKPQRYNITANTLPAVALTIQKQTRASSLEVSNTVDEALSEIQLPQGVHLSKFYDQSEIIGLTYRNMRNHLLMGAFLAILSVIFILGHNRTSYVIAITFPLTVLGTFWLMHSLNLGLNLMTLGALTVAIGMVADDAIVVLENIDRHRNLGQSPWDATLIGLREIIGADISGTLTVLAAFAPLVLVSGLAGRLFHPFGLSFSLLLLFSLILSLTIIPLAAVYWMRPVKKGTKKHLTLGERWVKWLEKVNLTFLDHLIRHKKITLLLAVIILAGSSVLLIFNPIRFLPLLDENSLLLSYQLTPGTSLTESNRVGLELERAILEIPKVQAVFRRTGSPESSFYLEGPDQGELVVRLDRSQQANALQIKKKLDQLLVSMPGVIGRVNEPTSEKLDESFSGMPGLFGITIYGTDLETLYAAANKVEQITRQTDGINNVVNNTKIPVDQILIRLDPVKLALRNVQASSASRAIKLALQGETISNVILNQQAIGIYLRFKTQSRQQINDLQRIPIPNRDGKNIPLGQLANISHSSGHPVIEHQHGLRSLTLSAEIDGNPVSVIATLNDNIAQLNLGDDIQVAYTGEYQQLIDTGLQMVGVLMGSALLVFAIIALQLGNFLDPLVVLVKLPLDFMGAALALFLTQQAIDLTVAIGFITLVGISTNNGIM
ncbi:MAG: efflux RND transporter permease subunit, partial [gamma proteobacterium symbiont of Bathyaustriella thionipta]|nr:efflux RND transporter permease subunit [gamma proteobacterium symbiont of Bathyaustriella thionipta]